MYTFVISHTEMRVFIGRGGIDKLISACDKFYGYYQSNTSDWMMDMEEILYDIGFCLNVDGVAQYLKSLKCLSVIFIPHLFLHGIPFACRSSGLSHHKQCVLQQSRCIFQG